MTITNEKGESYTTDNPNTVPWSFSYNAAEDKTTVWAFQSNIILFTLIGKIEVGDIWTIFDDYWTIIK